MLRGVSSGLGLFAGVCVVGVLFSPLSLLSSPLHPAPVVMQPGFSPGRETGLPVPRFVSLRPHKARMRIGPSVDYATRYLYQAQGLPMEITEEYGHWRQVRDSDGTSGWMFGSLLSSSRTGIIGPWLKDNVALRAGASAKASAVAMLQPKVRLQLSGCDGTWCRVHVGNDRLSGYVRQASIWGAYPGEVFG